MRVSIGECRRRGGLRRREHVDDIDHFYWFSNDDWERVFELVGDDDVCEHDVLGQHDLVRQLGVVGEHELHRHRRLSHVRRELFELSLLGGAVERRYRKARPEVERMPWGSVDPSMYTAEDVLAARAAWTLAAFQEHRTGAACATALRALIEARAPIDLVAL